MTGEQLEGPPDWAGWARELHSIARAGLSYAQSAYDLERYRRLDELAGLMLAALTGQPPARIRLELDADVGYVTPKLDARAAVHDAEGRLLMVRETHDGCWSMPGGWTDVNESLAEGVVREVREESGYQVAPDRLLGLYERERRGHPPMLSFTLKAVVACRIVGGEPAGSHETDEVGWFARDELPPLSVTRNSPELLRRVFEHHDDPSLPADLD